MANDEHIAQLKKGIRNAWREKNPLSKQRKRQGLSKLPPDDIVKARDDTAAQVNRITLTFVGAVVFCALTLSTPDTALLVGGERLNVPLAGPTSFFGFMLLGPVVLIVLRVYLQIYVEHQRRLDQIAQYVRAARTPTLIPDKNPILRIFNGIAFYLLLPLAMLYFWWKGAVFPEWGLYFFIAVAVVIAIHLTLPVRRLPWRPKALLGVAAAILAIAVIMSFGDHLRRPFYLFRANLSDQWLVSVDLRGAVLHYGNLSRAHLNGADLSGANLSLANLSNAFLDGANLSSANLTLADLSSAELTVANLTAAYLNNTNLSSAYLLAADLTAAYIGSANLSGANLVGAKLIGANLNYANLSSADLTNAKLSRTNLSGTHLSGTNLSRTEGLVQQQLDTACGDEHTQLPSGLSVKFCSHQN